MGKQPGADRKKICATATLRKQFCVILNRAAELTLSSHHGPHLRCHYVVRSPQTPSQRAYSEIGYLMIEDS